MNLPLAETQAARHAVEALFAVQAARRALVAGRTALGPMRGVEELWKRLDDMVSKADLALAELTILGQAGLELAPIHSGTGCGVCSPAPWVPTYTGGRR